MNDSKDVGTLTNETQALLEKLGLVQSPAKQEQLLAEVENLLKLAPPEPSLQTITGSLAASMAWAGSASAVISQWNSVRAISFQFAQLELVEQSLSRQVNGHRKIMMILHEAQQDLRLKTGGPLNVAIEKGRVFEYFEELKDIIKQANADVMFVDPYLDDDFISRYLPHVKNGVTIRLLTDGRYLSKLLPAVELFVAQHGVPVSVRTTNELHDRYLLIDRDRCFSSGSSFKDGAKKTGTTIVQMVDIFDAVSKRYEDLWASATVQR